MAKRRLAVEFEGVLLGVRGCVDLALDRDMPHRRFMALVQAVGDYQVIIYSAGQAHDREAIRAWIFASAIRGFAAEHDPDPVKAAADLVLALDMVQSMPEHVD